MSGTAATVDRACDACLRRAWLLAALVAHFERCSPRRSDLSGLLALPDGDLIRAVGGRDVPVLRDRYRGFAPSTLRSALAAFALHVVCRHDPAYPPQLAEAPDRPAALFVAGAWERFAALVAAPSVALVANGAQLAGFVPAAQGVDRDVQRARRLSHGKRITLRHLPKYCIGRRGQTP